MGQGGLSHDRSVVMRAPIRAICRRPAALGLGLAGITCIEAADGEAAAAAIAAMTHAPASGGVILIEQALHDALPRALRRSLAREGLPILMPFPGPRPSCSRSCGGRSATACGCADAAPRRQ